MRMIVARCVLQFGSGSVCVFLSVLISDLPFSSPITHAIAAHLYVFFGMHKNETASERREKVE